MGSQFTKEQTELFTRYQPTLHQACAFPAKFAEITENVSAELSAQKKDLGTVVGAIIKHQIKDPNVADSAKYYYLLMLKHFVDSGNNELVQQYVPKHLMKRLGMIALHRKEEKNMERGMDCLSLFALDPEMEKKTSGYDSLWEYNLFHLLLEVIRYWGTAQQVGQNKSMPQEYKLLYQSLINQQVFFPTDDFFINSSPTRPGGSHKAPPSVLAYASSKPAIQGNDPVSDPGLSNMPVSHTASNQPSPVTSNNQNQSLLKPPVQTPPTVSGQGRSVSAPPTPAAPKIDYKDIEVSLLDATGMRDGFVKMAMKSPEDENLDIFYEMYTTNCSSLLANKNMGLLKNDQSAKSIELGKQVDNEKQLDKLISQAWSESKSKSNPELLQKGILKAYMKVLNTDLTADPEYSPSLIQNISDSALGQSSQLQPSTSLAPQPGRPSFPTPPQQSSQRPSFNDLPALDNPPTRPPPRQAMMHSGQSADHSQDDPSLQLPSDLKPFTPPRPIPQSNPQPVNIKPPTPAVIDEGLGRNGGATKPNYAKLPGLDGVQSWGASPPNETIPRFGPPAGNSSLNKPPPPTQDNYVVQKAPQSQMTNSNWLKPEPPKPAVEKPAVKEKAPVESWEYKPDLTYSQMIKQAPSESTLFNTPGMYESERQKMRDQLMRNRQREFEDQLQTIRNQGDQEYNTPMHPLDFRATPSQLWTNQPTVNTYHSINDDYLNTLQERVFQSNSEFRKEQLEYQMLTNGVNSYQKATEYFEKETVKLSAKASDLTAEAEKLGADISLLKHSKEDLLQKIERKRAELLEQKRRANATSDGDHDRKRDMLDEMASLRRLAVYKTSEMSRVKAKYDELEREYHNHSLAKTKAMETPMKVLDRSLTASAMNDWAPWRNRFEEKTGEKSRRTHADMGTSLTQGESASFLADLNRSVDNLINNNSEFSSRKYRNL